MQKLISIAIIFVAAMLLGFGFVWPKYQFLHLTQNDIKQKEIELSSKTEYYSKIKDTAQELEKYQEELNAISSALPDELSLPSVFYFLQQTSAQTGLVLEDIILGSIVSPVSEENATENATENTAEGEMANPVSTPKKAKFKEVNVELRLSGSYTSLKDFLLALEQSARFTKIRTVDFTSPTEAEGSFSFQVGITTYSY